MFFLLNLFWCQIYQPRFIFFCYVEHSRFSTKNLK